MRTPGTNCHVSSLAQHGFNPCAPPLDPRDRDTPSSKEPFDQSALTGGEAIMIQRMIKEINVREDLCPSILSLV